ncbi:MAG: SRPBCC family protein [Bacteroidota bacterium]
MKTLQYALYTVAAIVGLFFLAGLLKSSVSYGHEVTVNKSIEEAWAVSQDESKYSQWLEGFQSIELISGEKGAVGSKYKIVVDPGDGQDLFEMVETVVSVKEFDHVSMEFDSEMMDFEQTMSFTKEGEQTRIKTESKVIGKSLGTRSMFAIMEMVLGAFTAQEAKNIEALKTLIENNVTNYSPLPSTAENATEAMN